MSDTMTFRVRLPRALVERIDAIATRTCASRDMIAERALSAWVEEQERRHALGIALARFRPPPPRPDSEARKALLDRLAAQPPSDAERPSRDALYGDDA